MVRFFSNVLVSDTSEQCLVGFCKGCVFYWNFGPWSTLVDHGRPWSTMGGHGRLWSTMVDHGRPTAPPRKEKPHPPTKSNENNTKNTKKQKRQKTKGTKRKTIFGFFVFLDLGIFGFLKVRGNRNPLEFDPFRGFHPLPFWLKWLRCRFCSSKAH